MQARSLLITAALCLAACAQSTADLKQELKRELLAALPDAVIIPAYQRFAAAVDELEQGMARGCTAGISDLPALQQHWRNAMSAWQKTAAYAYGPVARYDLPAVINYQPIRKNRIHHWLEPGRVVTMEEIKNYSVQGKGLGALEYLLFEPAIEKERTTTQYCAYLAALAGDLKTNARKILQLWQSDQNVQTSAVGPEAGQQILDEMLNTLFQTAETIKDEKLAVPLGKKQSGSIQADKLESWRSDQSLHNIRANVVSIQALFYGAIEMPPEPAITIRGLRGYLQKTGQPEAAAAMEQTLQKLIEELDRTGSSTLQTALREQPASIETIYRDVAALCHTLETDVLPAFDVQPGFNARDGD
jgi:predicted lipoprotein